MPMKEQGSIAQAYGRLAKCALCPRACLVDRDNGEIGYCGAGKDLMIAEIGPHFGEETPLVGRNGSGAVFMSGCPLKCEFCQNHATSNGAGEKTSVSEMVNSMMRLQQIGCHNINFVTPTHYTPHIMEAISLARTRGLRIPIVYNCGGYESVETLKMLEGYINIYMPDIKFLDAALAQRYCNVPDYPQVVKAAIKEMHRQVGDLEIDDSDMAVRGLLVRHLVMPGATDDSKAVIDFIDEEISPDTYLNVMEQYRPSFRAYKYPEINRPLTEREFKTVFDYAASKGLRLA